MRRKILLIPDSPSWILGRWAQEIVNRCSQEFDIYYLFTSYAFQNLGQLDILLPSMDAIHLLYPVESPIKEKLLNSGIPLIATIHHFVEWDTVKDYATADRIVTGSKDWVKHLEQRGIDPDRITLLYSGVDVDLFKPAPGKERRKRRRHFRLDQSAFLVGFSAKLSSNEVDRKGFRTFVEVAANLAAHLGNNIGFVVWGPSLDSLVLELVQRGVRLFYFPFLPRQSEVAALYACLDAFLICSLVEGGPVTLLEAMACGVPVVTTPVGLAKEIAVDRETALVVPFRDVAEMVGAIDLLRCNTSLRTTLAQKARQLVCTAKTWDHTFREVSVLYGSVPLRTRGSRCHLPVPSDQRRDMVRKANLLWLGDLLGATNLKTAWGFARDNELELRFVSMFMRLRARYIVGAFKARMLGAARRICHAR
jgi:glycosyltransferase involved in cell wall biosynthesis